MKKIIWSIAVKVVAFVLLAVCGAKIIFDSTHWITALFVGFLMVLSFPVCAVLHECGHMLFGAAVKIKAVPEKNFLKNTFLNWWDSSSCKIIPKTEKNLRGRVIFTAVGGPAVDFIFIVLGIVALCVPSVPTELSAFMPAAFHLFALNAAPFYFDGGKSDGEIIYELARGNDEAKVMLAVLEVQAQVLNGKPIKEVDRKLLFDLPQIREDDISFISLTELRYEYYLSTGDKENAEKQRARFEELKEQYL